MPRLSLLLSLALVVGCNEAPTASTPTISPTAPTTLEDLRLVIGEATDPNRSDSPTQIIRWSINGEEVPALDGRKTIPSSITAAGDVWTAKIIATDGDLESTPRTVSTTIVNTEAHGTVRFEDETPEPGDALTAVAVFADIDDNDVDLTWHWTVNDRSAPYYGDSIPAGVTEKGERWTVSVVGHDGTDSSEAAQSTVVIGNSAPTIATVTLGPDGAVAGDDIVVTASAIDADGDTVSFRYSWVVDGQVMDETSGVLDGSELARDQRVDVWVTATDGTASSQPVRASVVVANSVPAVDAAVLSHDSATVSDHISCSAQGVSDADGDDVELSYVWSINGTDVAFGPIFDAPLFRGDEVICSIIASDDADDSAPTVSPTLTIDNSVPTDGGLQFTTDAPTAGSDLGVAFVDTFDADGDEIFETFAWTIGTKSIQEGPWLSAGEFVRGDVITVTASVSDGIDQGAIRTASVTVANAAPVVQDVILSGSPVSGELTATTTATDADNDALTTSYDWYINGSSSGITTATIPGTLLQRGDEVGVSVSVSDGMGGVTPGQSGIILVSNRVPALASVGVDTAEANPGDVINAVFDPATDVDGDDITYTYEWRIDGTVAGTESSITLSESTVGNELTLTVTPADAFGAGESVTSNLVPFVNQAPTVTDVVVTPASGATVSSVLTAAYTATDLENNDLTPTFTWFVNGTVQPVTGPNFAVGEYASKGDEVWATVSVADDQNTSDAVTSDTITIDNSAPEPLMVSFEPATLEPNVALKCAVNGLSDADGDDLTITVSWFADGDEFEGTTEDGSYEGDTIPADAVGLFETWECQATASDGTAASTAQVVDDDVTFSHDNIIGEYDAGSFLFYRVRAIEIPQTDAQDGYAQACTEVGAQPISCDANVLGSDYDASAYGALAVDVGTYGCDVSASVATMTGWQGLVSFHQPAIDARGVCEEGCIEESAIAYPLCGVPND